MHRNGAPSRQRIACTFWPESPESQARTNLRQALHNLRRALPDPDRWLALDGQSVRWLDDAPAFVDLVAFEAAATQAEASGERPSLEGAVALYAGDLLPGCYDEWIGPERERLRQRCIVMLEQLATLAEHDGDRVASLRSAERLLQLDPLHEASYRRLMRLHLEAGERARALRVYHVCVDPRARARRLARLRDRRGLRATARGRGTANHRSPTRRSSARRRSSDGPQRGSWWRCWQDAERADRPGAGHGRGRHRQVPSRRRLPASCARRGTATAASRAATRPRAGCPTARRRSAALAGRPPTLTGLEPVWRREIARLLPELDAEHTELGPVDRPGDSHRGRIFEALARALTGAGGPLLLVIDDLQWAGVETLEFLHFLLRFAAPPACSWSGPPAPRRSTPTTRSRAGRRPRWHRRAHPDPAGAPPGGRRRKPRPVVLGTPPARRPCERVVEASEGNPLFLVELARSGLAAGGHPVTRRCPAGCPRGADGHRTPSGQAVHPGARRRRRGCRGRPGVLDRRHHSADRRGRRARPALDELWRRGIMRERGVDGYDFSHDKIREVAYSSSARLGAGSLHLEVAGCACGSPRRRDRRRGRPDRGPLRPGRLARAAPIDYYQRAIDGAAHVFAHEEVIAFARPCPRSPRRCPASAERGDRELAILVPLGVALYSGPELGSEVHEVFERAAALRAERGQPPDPSTSRIMANLALVRRDYVESQHRGEMLVARGEQLKDALLVTEGHYLVGVSAFWRGAFERSRVHLQRALDTYDPEREAQHLELFGQDPVSVCLVRLAFTLWVLGRADEADRLRQMAFDRADSLRHRYTQAYVRTFVAWNAVEAGLDEEAARLADGFRTDGWSSGNEVLRLSSSPVGRPSGEVTLAQGYGCWRRPAVPRTPSGTSCSNPSAPAPRPSP